mmetsp:Transcript_17012/g.25740  ORF Transcript_17012/g.25740 Transcript_17012/m.25740 type:complete len:97 (+) Transcript_17012:354-644(+)
MTSVQVEPTDVWSFQHAIEFLKSKNNDCDVIVASFCANKNFFCEFRPMGLEKPLYIYKTDALVEGTLPRHRVTKIYFPNNPIGRNELEHLFWNCFS